LKTDIEGGGGVTALLIKSARDLIMGPPSTFRGFLAGGAARGGGSELSSLSMHSPPLLVLDSPGYFRITDENFTRNPFPPSNPMAVTGLQDGGRFLVSSTTLLCASEYFSATEQKEIYF